MMFTAIALLLLLTLLAPLIFTPRQILAQQAIPLPQPADEPRS